MITLNNFIVERLKLGKDTKVFQYKYHPKDLYELRDLLKQLLDERGPNADLNDIDVSQVTTFFIEEYGLWLFSNLDPHNIDISGWDVSNVENMRCTFYNCPNFNCNLSRWNVSNVENMMGMFHTCENFTGDGLENWKPIKCKDMSCMFIGCKKFNCNLSKWDVSDVKDMVYMFDKCTNFTGDGLENWKPIKCKKIRHMFNDCDSLKNYPSWYK